MTASFSLYGEVTTMFLILLLGLGADIRFLMTLRKAVFQPFEEQYINLDSFWMETTWIEWLFNHFPLALCSRAVFLKQQPMGKKKKSSSDIWILWLPFPASMDNSWATAELWKGISIILCQYKLRATFTRSFISSLKFEGRSSETVSSELKAF